MKTSPVLSASVATVSFSDTIDLPFNCDADEPPPCRFDEETRIFWPVSLGSDRLVLDL